MGKKFRMGIIGCGGIANGHINGINDCPDLEVSALCDTVPGQLKIKADLYGFTDDMFYADYNDLLDSGKVDAVSICTPNNIHCEIALAAIERGIPFAVEKPVGLCEAQVARVLEAAEKKGVPHMVCFSYRFKSAARYIRALVQKGELGGIYHINGEYLQAWGLPDARGGKPTPLAWRFVKDITGSGALGDLGCHILDLFRFMLDREFTRVSADMDTFITERELIGGGGTGKVDVDDYINIVGQMEGKVAANLSITRYAYSRGNYQRVEIYGEKGALRYTLEAEDTLEVNYGNEPMRNARVWAEIPVPPQYERSQMQSFADILNGRGDGLAANLRDGLNVQRLLDRSVVSAEKGVRVNL